MSFANQGDAASVLHELCESGRRCVFLHAAFSRGEEIFRLNMLFEIDFRVFRCHEIDIAERPEVYCRHGQVGNFIGRRGNFLRPGKSKFPILKNL
jgi:hypothetical protein